VPSERRLSEIVPSAMSRFWMVPSAIFADVTRLPATADPPPTSATAMTATIAAFSVTFTASPC